MASIDLLQDIQIKKAKPKEKDYFLNDGGGLRIKIKKDGNKIWEFRFTFNGKRKMTTFKSYPITSLKNARDKRNECLDLISKEINPIDYKREEKQNNIIDEKGQFLQVAKEWLDKESLRTQISTHKGKLRVFENDIYPFLKNKHIQDVDINDIIKIIEIKQLQAHEVASKIFNYLDKLFRYAVLKKYCTRNLLSDIRKSDIIRPKEVKHMAKITDENILKELINTIYTYTGSHSIRNVLKLVLHLPLRAENICNLKWDYVNLIDKSLTIPRKKMKIKSSNLDDFKLPLTDEAINILKEQALFTSDKEYIFLGADNKSAINNESPNRALQRMGFNDDKRGRKIRLHGFRGTFRSIIDTLDTNNSFSFEVKERALDHHEKNQVARAYNHKADYYKQLIPLMSFWSAFIMSLRD